MPPKRKPVQKSTLGRFFDIKLAAPAPPARKQPSLDKFFCPSLLATPALTSSASSARPSPAPSSNDLTAQLDETILISDSSDDELVDADSILGTPKPASDSSSTTPVVEIVTPKRSVRKPAGVPMRKPVYRNSLKSLVRDKKKYDLAVLDEPMDHSSADEDDGGVGEEQVERLMLNEEEAASVRAQLGAMLAGDSQASVAVRMFAGRSGDRTLKPLHPLDTNNMVDKVCVGARPLVVERLVCSQWLLQRVHTGWRLSPGIGDLLFRLVVGGRSMRVSAMAFITLVGFLEARMSQWQLSLTQLEQALETLQGPPVATVEMQYGQSTPQRSSECAENGGGQRTQYVLGIAARALPECMPPADTARALNVAAETILDRQNQPWLAANQQSLAMMVDRVAPRSKWSLVWSEHVLHLTKRLQALPAAVQAAVMERLPAGSARTRQVRRTLAFAMLWMTARPEDELAARITLPPQLLVRMASELLDDVLVPCTGNDEFGRLAACVALLGNVLDCLVALQDVAEEVAQIYAKLAMANRRIADGRADNMDKTRAKDALQTLLVRINLTVVADERARNGQRERHSTRLSNFWKP